MNTSLGINLGRPGDWPGVMTLLPLTWPEELFEYQCYDRHFEYIRQPGHMGYSTTSRIVRIPEFGRYESASLTRVTNSLLFTVFHENKVRRPGKVGFMTFRPMMTDYGYRTPVMRKEYQQHMLQGNYHHEGPGTHMEVRRF